MINKNYADFAWEQTTQLLAIDSPTGYTAKAAQWVKEAFEALGFSTKITNKGGVLIDLAVRMKMTVWFWLLTLIPWAPWFTRSRATAACA